ncbi:phage baseplate assembly protein V [Paracraurococcus lichenis]|uniref:Phage baseplate assembly protein V n=1 Tax=Paracraurococcus lichenis TaxID=3064888 RepID=A0ABT9E9M5_9PROT|nr:phage baseplate assembly protein V [Paracraurococcus sp. LOR1-02]MDO9712900.1 phage baseplate assembly protein V [Paracraurococcus sp. LOR1-02]
MEGVAIGTVVDRDGQGRVKLRFPWLDDAFVSDWVPVAAPMAGAGRGLFMMPEVGDEVLCAFQHGTFEHPVVIGFLWNGVDKPPTDEPRERMICTRNGHKIRFLDSTPTGGDMGGIIVQDAHGNSVSLSNGQVAVTAVAVVQITAPTVLINGRLVLPVPNPI